MTASPAVTVLCATLNACEVVRLTFASFHRYTPEPRVVFVADNGSTDGTLDHLRALPWLTVYPLSERRTQRDRSAALARGEPEGEGTGPSTTPGVPVSDRPRRSGVPIDAPDPAAALTEHGATLDWLAAQVRTPFFLTLDSDVEFLAAGWLSEMLDQMIRDDLVALGPYEPGLGGYRPRLAPYVLLLRTAAFRALQTSFRGYTLMSDPAEAVRWLARTRLHSFNLDPEEVSRYRSAVFYSTAARLFERLEQTGARWSDLAEPVARKFLHLGHMSWASYAAGESNAAALRREHAAQRAYVERRLRLLGL